MLKPSRTKPKRSSSAPSLEELKEIVERLSQQNQSQDKIIDSLKREISELKSRITTLERPLSEQLAELQVFEIDINQNKLRIDRNSITIHPHTKLNVQSKEIDIRADTNLKIETGRDLNLKATANTTIESAAMVNVKSAANLTLKGAQIRLNP
jgi:predicted RNase H-like nuclease (RuvC/YqgF family)